MPAEIGIKALTILSPDALDRTLFDHSLRVSDVDGTVVSALLPAFEKKGQHLIRLWKSVLFSLVSTSVHSRSVNRVCSISPHRGSASGPRLLVCLRNPVSYKTNSSTSWGNANLETQGFNFATLRIVALSEFATRLFWKTPNSQRFAFSASLAKRQTRNALHCCASLSSPSHACWK